MRPEIESRHMGSSLVAEGAHQATAEPELEPEPLATYDAETYTLRTTGSKEVSVELFQKVRVRISDQKDETTGKRGVKMELVSTTA